MPGPLSPVARDGKADPQRNDASAPGGSRVLGAGSIALISLAAVLTLRGTPSVAEYGWSSVAFYLLGAVFFFVPLALVAAELATGWPRAGGLYSWVREAFGERWGFLAVWLEWVENLVWFPTVLAFVAATLAYAVNPSLADNKSYLVVMMLTIFWVLTLANFFGMQWTARLNNPGVIAGTIFPALVLIGLGGYWLVSGRHSAIPFSADKLVPNLGSANNLVFFAGVLLGFGGIEMAGFHAKETRNPGRDYPRAIFMAAGLIVGISILATLSVAIVVPQAKLSLVSGLLQAFDSFFSSLGIGTWATKVMAALVGLGTLALISTWLLGPAKGLYASEKTGNLPPQLHYVNRRHVPVAILVTQGILGSLFALVFLFVPTINTSYWMLSALTTQIIVLMYLMVFAAVIRLRYTQPQVHRPYTIPGGMVGIWLLAGLGIVGSLFGLVIGFIPPSGLTTWPAPLYAAAMVAGIAICSAPPFIIEKIKKPGWTISDPDDVLLDVVEDPAMAAPSSTVLAPTGPAPPGGPHRRSSAAPPATVAEDTIDRH